MWMAGTRIPIGSAREVIAILRTDNCENGFSLITNYFSQGALELSNTLASILRILGDCSGEKKLREGELN